VHGICNKVVRMQYGTDCLSLEMLDQLTELRDSCLF